MTMTFVRREWTGVAVERLIAICALGGGCHDLIYESEGAAEIVNRPD